VSVVGPLPDTMMSSLLATAVSSRHCTERRFSSQQNRAAWTPPTSGSTARALAMAAISASMTRYLTNYPRRRSLRSATQSSAQRWQESCVSSELRPQEGHGWFGIGIYRGKSEVNHGTLWRSAFQMGASFIFTVQARYSGKVSPGSSDTTRTWAHLPCFRYESLDTLKASQPEACEFVAVEMGGEPLETFRHPPRAVYILGAEDDGVPQSIIDRCQHHVSLPTVRSASMNVAAAGSVMLYDRMIKRLLLDPFPHLQKTVAKPRKRLASAIASNARRLSFAAAKRHHVTGTGGRTACAALADFPDLWRLVVYLNENGQPFFVRSASPPSISGPHKGASFIFTPMRLQVDCMDLYAAHALMTLTMGGKCCKANISQLDESKVAVELCSRRGPLEVFPQSSVEAATGEVPSCDPQPSSSEVSSACFLSEAGLALVQGVCPPARERLQARFTEAIADFSEFADRLASAKPGWALRSSKEPRADDDSTDAALMVSSLLFGSAVDATKR